MSSSVPLEFEARILWKSLIFLKWASAHEIDFISFKVEIDYKKGVFQRTLNGGEKEILGSFSPQKKASSVSDLNCPIEIPNGYILSLEPQVAVANQTVIHVSNNLQKDTIHQLMINSTKQEWSIGNEVKIKSIHQRGSSSIHISCSKENMQMALVLACLIVFLRFSY